MPLRSLRLRPQKLRGPFSPPSTALALLLCHRPLQVQAASCLQDSPTQCLLPKAHSSLDDLTNLPGWVHPAHRSPPAWLGSLPTWVDAEGALDEAAPHAGSSADDGVHV